jgi:cellobionic acid phosphorylase
MADHVGKLTLKSPGTGENGSIYSHAALFWSYALFRCGRSTEAWRVLRNLVPGTPDNPIESAGQVPLYIPNFYRGPASPDIFGISSHAPNTGSAAWVYMTYVECVIGLKADGDQLLVQPCLPDEWDKVSGERLFRGTCYQFTMERQAGLQEMRVELDGEVIEGPVKWEASSKPLQLRVLLPAAGKG